MPEYKRQPNKFLSRGVGLRHPPDLLPEGLFPLLNNMEVDELSDLTVRRGIGTLNGIAYADPIHSMRRLQDLTTGQSALIVGAGTSLYTDASAVAIDSGYSGNPLSMLMMRPSQSPRPWMYIGDSTRLRKVLVDGTDYALGIAPPTSAPGFSRGAPNIGNTTGVANNLGIADFDAEPPWSDEGTTNIGGTTARFNDTITAILYDSGTTGWACIRPSATTLLPNYQVGALCVLTNAAVTEAVQVRQVFKAITSTTIDSILYDSGTTGLCSITLNALASEYTGLLADAMLLLGGATEYIRVLSVALASDGTVSFRCSTVSTHAAGDAVTGVPSFRAYTTIAKVATNTITTTTLISFTTTVGAGRFNLDLSATPRNLVNINSRPVQEDDFIHISFRVDFPTRITSLRIYFNVDPAFPAAMGAVVNALYYDVTVADLRDSYTELFFRVSDLVATGIGVAQSLNLSAVTGLIFDLVASATVIIYPDSFWIGGTYGPDSDGLTPYTVYQRYRSAVSGAVSNPSPATTTSLDLKRELGLITPVVSTDPQVTLIDLFAIGGTMTEVRKIGTTPNSATPFSFDSTNAANAANEILSFTNFQPFPVSDIPRAGTVTTSGTSVLWISGDTFNVLWQAGSQIIINSIAYTLAAPPASTTRLTIIENAGSQTAVAFTIPEATIGGQPLAFIWGPDPLTNVMFGVGTPLAAGTLFWSNPGDPDSVSDANSYEVCSPSEPLLGGFMYNGSSYVWSIQKLYRASAQQSINPLTGAVTITYLTQEVPNFKGIFTPHAFCVGDLIWQITSEGVYESSGGQPRSITDETLYPLFAHGGGVATAPTNGYYPIDFNFPDKIRIAYTKGALFLSYQDTQGAVLGWKYDRTLPVPGWFGLNYSDVYPNITYGDELQGSVDVLMGGETFNGTGHAVYRLGTGTSDNNEPIVWAINTPAFDYGDPRSEKLCLDYMLDCNPDNITFDVALYGNNLQTLIAASTITGTVRAQFPKTAITAALSLYRNFGLYISGSTITGLPTFYEFEPNSLLQPYFALNFSNQYQSHHFTNYGHIRDGWIMYISTTTLTFTVIVDGGTAYSFSIPSSLGLPVKLYLFDALITPPTSTLFTRKGKIFLYSVTSSSPFVLFTDETIINAKEWASTGAYLPFKPFVGQTA